MTSNYYQKNREKLQKEARERYQNLFEKDKKRQYQFAIFKPLSYCFEKIIGFDVKASFACRSMSRLIG